MAAIGQRGRGDAPGAARIRGCRPHLGRAVEHLHGAVGGRRARQGQRVVVGDTVASHPAVGGERRDRRRRGRRRWRDRIAGSRRRRNVRIIVRNYDVAVVDSGRIINVLGPSLVNPQLQILAAGLTPQLAVIIDDLDAITPDLQEAGRVGGEIGPNLDIIRVTACDGLESA